MYKNVLGVILAGGENKRFNGFNKAFVYIDNERIIDRTINVLKKIFYDIVVITNRPSDYLEFKDIEIITDIVHQAGPLGGIYTALKSLSTEAIFVVGCDMPYIKQPLIEKIIKISKKNHYVTTVPFSPYGLEPLFAVYNKKDIPQIENAIRSNNYSISEVIRNSSAKLVKLTKDELASLESINSLSQLITIEKGLCNRTALRCFRRCDGMFHFIQYNAMN